MTLVGSFQQLVLLVLTVVALALEVYALVDAVRHRPDAYVAAEKRTKPFWVTILAVAAAFGFIAVPPPIGIGSSFFGLTGFLALLAVVAAAVYLTDVRPAVQQMRGRGGRGGRSGPYGPY